MRVNRRILSEARSFRDPGHRAKQAHSATDGCQRRAPSANPAESW
jgi:hypothetical protein